MNGFAGQLLLRNLRQEEIMFKEYAKSFWKESADLVVG
jgi:hypothetical protein